MVQPVLGPFGESPETFLSAGASTGDIIWFAVLVTVVPFLVIVLLASLTRLFGARPRAVVQLALVGVLVVVATTALLDGSGLGLVLKAALPVALAAAAVVAYHRWEPVRLFLRYASPAPLLMALMFCFASPVSALVRPVSATPTEHAATDEEVGPVVMIVLDELPTASIMDGAGGIDRELFPNLARLADTSTWYRNHTAVSDRTLMSMPAITTGLFPSGPERAVSEANYPENIFTMFAPTHEVRAVEWFSDLCPGSVCDEPPEIDEEARALLNAQIRTSGPMPTLIEEAARLWWGQVWPSRGGGETEHAMIGMTEAAELVEPGLQFLSSLDDPSGDRPVLDFLHATTPHQPWVLLPSGADYDGAHPAPGSEFGAWAGGDAGEQLADHARSRHLLQMQWTDRLLGAVFDRLDELGRWDDATVVVTGDHGVSFTPGTLVRDPTPDTQADIYWTPLFIKAPGQTQGEVVDDNVMAVDVVPTIAELAGVELGVEFDGVSLVGAVPSDRAKKARVARDLEQHWPGRNDDGIVELDQSVFDTVIRTPAHASGPVEIRPWRHGRHGELLGRSTDELGVCDRRGPVVEVDQTWDPSRGPLPLWHTATIEVDDAIDVAAVIDGRVVAWNQARPWDGSPATLELLLSEPLVEGASSAPELHQIVDGDDCRLVPLSAG